MVGTFFPLLLVLLLIASFMRGDFALTLIYLVVGALAAGVWWSRRALTQVETRRRFSACVSGGKSGYRPACKK
jgi:hypothetical protein